MKKAMDWLTKRGFKAEKVRLGKFGSIAGKTKLLMVKFILELNLMRNQEYILMFKHGKKKARISYLMPRKKQLQNCKEDLGGNYQYV